MNTTWLWPDWTSDGCSNPAILRAGQSAPIPTSTGGLSCPRPALPPPPCSMPGWRAPRSAYGQTNPAGPLTSGCRRRRSRAHRPERLPLRLLFQPEWVARQLVLLIACGDSRALCEGPARLSALSRARSLTVSPAEYASSGAPLRSAVHKAGAWETARQATTPSRTRERAAACRVGCRPPRARRGCGGLRLGRLLPGVDGVPGWSHRCRAPLGNHRRSEFTADGEGGR